MAVLVDSGPVEATDNLRDVPPDKWRMLMVARQLYMRTKLSHDCRCLVEFVGDADHMYSDLGFEDPEDMVRRGYGLDPEIVGWAIAGLRKLRPEEPLSLSDAAQLGKHGGDRRSEQAKADQGGHSTLKPSEKNTVAHWLARLARDHPDILAAYERGEFKSARAAAKAAGIIKEKPAIEKIRALLPKLTVTECVVVSAEAALLADKLHKLAKGRAA